MAGKTPLPVPKFFKEYGSEFSTKKERRGCRSRLDGSPALARLHAPAKTAPPISRVYPRRWSDQRPHFISFKASHSESFLSSSLPARYDDSLSESYLEQAFLIIDRIGHGSFGEVFKVKSRADGQLYAVKRALTKFRSEADRAGKLGEVQKHEALPSHPNLVRFVQAWEERGRLYIQTELCRSSLAQLSEAAESQPLPESLLWDVAVDLLLALNHLHSHDLLHLDIKPDNIFVSPQGLCKLGDFGLVFDLMKEPIASATEGDNRYMAPELFHDGPTKAVDIFSLGISLLEMAADLDVPAQGEAWQALRRLDHRRDFPAPIRRLLARLSPEFVRLVRDMLDANPARRPSAATLLKRPELQAALRRRKLFQHWCLAKNMAWSLVLGVFCILCHIWRLISGPFLPKTTGSERRESVERSRFGLGESPVGERGLAAATPHPPRLAMPLSFDSDADEDEEDEGLGDVSSIPGDLLHPHPEEDMDEEEEAMETMESEPSLPSITASPAPFRRLPRRPFNSTPANQDKKRSRIDPKWTAGPRLESLSASPILGAGDGQEKRRPPTSTRASLARARNPLSPVSSLSTLPSALEEAIDGAGDSPSRRRLCQSSLSKRNLRLAFNRHGSSSEDET